MKGLIIAVAILALSVPAFAGQNPDIGMYLVTGSDGTGDNYIEPVSTFNIYVCFDGFGPGGGMLGASFMFDRTFSGFKLAQTNLLGGLDFGDVETAGWAITSGADCAMPVGGVVVAATVQYLYQGTPGTITVGPHPVDGMAVADCNNDLDFFCVHSIAAQGVSGNFGVFMPAPDGTCEPITPVEDSSWGAIKALYR